MAKKNQEVGVESIDVTTTTTTSIVSLEEKNNIEEEEDEDDDDDDDDATLVSDAEALLACYSYLRRRKRLGNSWTQLERRKLMKASAEPHFFWEDAEFNTKNSNTFDENHPDDEFDGSNFFDDNDNEEDDGDWTEEDTDADRPDRTTSTTHADEIWYGEFTSFPLEPTKTRARRSQAAKTTWQDPEFRKRWYKIRWGSESSNAKSKSTRDEKLLATRVRALPSKFLGSPELASMTEAEIDHAIQSYVQAKLKRVESRRKTLQQRKADLLAPKQSEERVPRDSLFQRDQEALKEAQRLRSERARAAYAKRLQNQRDKQGPPVQKVRKAIIPNRATPQDALLRIEDALDRGQSPSVEDVKVIMKPLKLGKRKVLLKRLLNDCFDLRGKCVPIDLKKPDGDVEFVTQSTIGDLGDFCIHLLVQKNPKLKSKAKKKAYPLE